MGGNSYSYLNKHNKQTAAYNFFFALYKKSDAGLNLGRIRRSQGKNRNEKKTCKYFNILKMKTLKN